MNIKLDTNTIRSINAFEKITGAEVKDCIIEGNSAYFVVEEGKVGLVIGKNGRTIRKVQNTIGKKVRIFEFSPNLEKFVKNLISAPVENIKVENKTVSVVVANKKKSMVIGRDGKNSKIISRLLKRHFEIEDLKIY